MKGYKEFQELLKLNFHPAMMRMKGKAGDVNRLSARIVFVQNYRGILFENYKEESANAYSSLFQVFLTYSAFEMFMKLFKCDFYDIDSKYPDHKYDALSDKIRKIDRTGKFYKAILEHISRERLRRRLSNFREGNHNNPLVFAACIRHAFAHGKLSANPSGASSIVVKKVCDELYTFMLDIVDTEFEKRVLEFYEIQREKGLYRKMKK